MKVIQINFGNSWPYEIISGFSGTIVQCRNDHLKTTVVYFYLPVVAFGTKVVFLNSRFRNSHTALRLSNQ